MKLYEVLQCVADDTGVPKRIAGIVVRSAFVTISEALARQERVAIPRFGAFSTAYRSGRKVRHPVTSDLVHVRAKRVAVFRAFAELRAACRSRSAK